MRILKVTSVVAILALVACGDQQTAGTEEPPSPPAAEEAPVAEVPAEAMAEAPEDFREDLPRTTNGPPAPSAVFEDGVDALGEIDESVLSIFADAPFGAGDYLAEGFLLSITDEGDFTLTIESDGRELNGDLRVYGDMFIMSNVTQEAATGEFPMTCLVMSAPNGFELVADGRSCDLLDGLTFARVE